MTTDADRRRARRSTIVLAVVLILFLGWQIFQSMASGHIGIPGLFTVPLSSPGAEQTVPQPENTPADHR